MNTFKTNKGITLVALIITIIVLLILTVVAISSITDQGLFTKSQEAVNKYEEKREEEQNTLTDYASEIDKYLTKKDKVYLYQGDGYTSTVTLTPDNQMIVITGSGEKEVYTCRYVEVTQEFAEQNGLGDLESLLSVYSRIVILVTIPSSDGEVLVGRSKDEKTLYWDDAEFILVEE